MDQNEALLVGNFSRCSKLSKLFINLKMKIEMYLYEVVVLRSLNYRIYFITQRLINCIINRLISKIRSENNTNSYPLIFQINKSDVNIYSWQKLGISTNWTAPSQSVKIELILVMCDTMSIRRSSSDIIIGYWSLPNQV